MTLETFLTSVVDGAVTTWADGFGVWHVRVSRSCVAPILAARRALRDELQAREANIAREAWLHCVEVPELSDAETVVYRERDIAHDVIAGRPVHIVSPFPRDEAPHP